MLTYGVPEELRKIKIQKILALDYRAISRNLLSEFRAYIANVNEDMLKKATRGNIKIYKLQIQKGEKHDEQDFYTIYFRANSEMDTVKYYVWIDSFTVLNTWLGADMTYEGDWLWKCVIPAEYENIIFNDGSGWQTMDLVIPKDGRNLFDERTGLYC